MGCHVIMEIIPPLRSYGNWKRRSEVSPSDSGGQERNSRCVKGSTTACNYAKKTIQITPQQPNFTCWIQLNPLTSSLWMSGPQSI